MFHFIFIVDKLIQRGNWEIRKSYVASGDEIDRRFSAPAAPASLVMWSVQDCARARICLIEGFDGFEWYALTDDWHFLVDFTK